jgi:hypothetical protein
VPVGAIHPEPHRLVCRIPIKVILEFDDYLLHYRGRLTALRLSEPYKINYPAPITAACWLAHLDRFRGAKRRANVGRRQATSGGNELRFPQVDRLLGHTQPHAATARMRLKRRRPTGTSGLVGGIRGSFGELALAVLAERLYADRMRSAVAPALQAS